MLSGVEWSLAIGISAPKKTSLEGRLDRTSPVVMDSRKTARAWGSVLGISTLCLLRMINTLFGLFSQRVGLSKGKKSIVRGTLYGECLRGSIRRRGARHSSQLQVQGQEVAPDSGTRVLGTFGGKRANLTDLGGFGVVSAGFAVFSIAFKTRSPI